MNEELATRNDFWRSDAECSASLSWETIRMAIEDWKRLAVPSGDVYFVSQKARALCIHRGYIDKDGQFNCGLSEYQQNHMMLLMCNMFTKEDDDAYDALQKVKK